MIKADTPNLWEIRREMGHDAAMAVVILALDHMARMVNLDEGHNINDAQATEVANDLVAEKGYLKVEEIKFVLKRAVRKNKLFGRLDYSVVMSWFEEYDAERTEHAMDISNQNETQLANEVTQTEGAVTYQEWLASLKERAKSDPEAAKTLAGIEAPAESKMRLISGESERQKEIEFKRFFIDRYVRKDKDKTPTPKRPQ